MGGGRDNIIEDNIMVNTRLSYDERLYYDQWEMHNAVYQTGGLWGNLLRDPAYGTKEWALLLSKDHCYKGNKCPRL